MARVRDSELRRPGVRVGRVAGVDVFAHWSAIGLALLVVVNLALVALPAWHPTWSAGVVWAVAIGATIALILSLAAHELAHAIVARRQGRRVRGVTLFALGGITTIEGEARSPRDELAVAIAGPVTSLGIGFGALTVAVVASAGGPDASLVTGSGPAITLVAWLGSTNLVLGLFNLVPGFPLDGGRVLRALLWWSSGDLRRATRRAAAVGQVVAWLLLGAGLVVAFGGTPLSSASGLWLMLIGWFLAMSARGAYQEVLLRRALEDVPIASLVRPPVETVTPDTPVEAFVRHQLLPSRERSFPVVVGDKLAGMIDVEDVERLPREKWRTTAVGEIMQPPDRWPAIELDDDGLSALLAVAEHEQVPVVAHGRLLGVARRADLLKRLALDGPR